MLAYTESAHACCHRQGLPKGKKNSPICNHKSLLVFYSFPPNFSIDRRRWRLLQLARSLSLSPHFASRDFPFFSVKDFNKRRSPYYLLLIGPHRALPSDIIMTMVYSESRNRLFPSSIYLNLQSYSWLFFFSPSTVERRCATTAGTNNQQPSRLFFFPLLKRNRI